MPSKDEPVADTPRERGPITLAQFLKVVDAADSGGMAKALIRDGAVTVNGEPENRPGRKLEAGDVVEVAGQDYTVDR